MALLQLLRLLPLILQSQKRNLHKQLWVRPCSATERTKQPNLQAAKSHPTLRQKTMNSPISLQHLRILRPILLRYLVVPPCSKITENLQMLATVPIFHLLDRSPQIHVLSLPRLYKHPNPQEMLPYGSSRVDQLRYLQHPPLYWLHLSELYLHLLPLLLLNEAFPALSIQALE